jgi:DNA-binding CsgD family transcriptional regulator/PAS domain-containing protein
MREAEVVSTLIGDIYDAALEPSRWVDTLVKIREFVVGSAAALFWRDAASRNGAVHYDDGGIDPRYRQSYFDHYTKLDPTTTGIFFAKIGEPTATSDCVPYDEFLATRFYREWAQPQGLVDCANVVLEKSLTTYAAFNVFRHERHGVADQGMRERMRLIAPHVRRAVLIGKVIDVKTAEAATFAEALDGIAAGIFMVDASGRIVHANAAGHALLAAGHLLRAASGRLAATEPETGQALLDTFTAAGDGDAAVGTKGIAVPLTARDGERHVAHVLPLMSGARRVAGASYAAAAVLFVHKASLSMPSAPEVIAKTYRLTPSELRVLLAIVEVGGIPETAEALGVAETTVKFHLQNLFEKTGARRQADLVKLVSGFCSPLAG